MSEEEFFGKLKEYLTNRFNKEEIIKKRQTRPYYTIDKGLTLKSPEGTELRWSVGTSGEYPKVEEDSEGKVFVWSPPTGDFDDFFPLKSELKKFFRRWRRRYKRYEAFDEHEEFYKMMLDKRRWKEIEEDEAFKWVINSLRKDEEIARKVSERTGFKIVCYIPSPPRGGNRFYFYTCFDSKGMSDEEKMKMIEKAIDAVEEARKELWTHT